MRKAFDLRQLEFSDIMGRGFSLYAAAFFAFARWFLLAWTLPMIALTCGLFVLLDPYDWQHLAVVDPQSVFEPGARAAYYWLLKVASVALGLTVGAAGIYYTAARMYVGGRPTLGEVARAFSGRGPHLLGASFFHLLAILAITLAIFGLPLSMILGGETIWGWVLVFLLSFVWVPLLGWYVGTWGLNVTTVMLDESDALESFPRSAFLTKGFRVRLFGVMIAAILVAGAPGVPGLLTVPAWIGQEVLLEKGWPLIGDLIRVVWEGALLPLFFIPQVVFYFDMRCRKEGYDLAVMARNFGIEEGEMMRYRMNPHLGYRPPGYTPPKGRRAPRPAPQPAAPAPQFAQPVAPPQFGQPPQFGNPPQPPHWTPPQPRLPIRRRR
jgi:hypothetical protein